MCAYISTSSMLLAEGWDLLAGFKYSVPGKGCVQGYPEGPAALADHHHPGHAARRAGGGPTGDSVGQRHRGHRHGEGRPHQRHEVQHLIHCTLQWGVHLEHFKCC